MMPTKQQGVIWSVTLIDSSSQAVERVIRWDPSQKSTLVLGGKNFIIAQGDEAFFIAEARASSQKLSANRPISINEKQSMIVSPAEERTKLEAAVSSGRTSHSTLQIHSLGSLYFSAGTQSEMVPNCGVMSIDLPNIDTRLAPTPISIEDRLFQRLTHVTGALCLCLMVATEVLRFTTSDGVSVDGVSPEVAKILAKPIKKKVVDQEKRRSMASRAKGSAVAKQMNQFGSAFRSLASVSQVTNAFQGAAKTSAWVASRTSNRALTGGAAGESTSGPVALVGAGANGGSAYGAGDSQAQIAGQGRGFVSLDLAQATVDEGLSREEVGRVIHAHFKEIRYCYESSLIRNPNNEGKVILDFSISGGGKVSSAKVQDNNLPDIRVSECIVAKLKTWGFPKPKGGVEVAVSYPFVFKNLMR